MYGLQLINLRNVRGTSSKFVILLPNGVIVYKQVINGFRKRNRRFIIKRKQ